MVRSVVSSPRSGPSAVSTVGPGRDPRAVGYQWGDVGARQFEGDLRHREAGHDAVAAGDDAGDAAQVGRDGRLAGDVHATGKVLRECCTDQRLDECAWWCFQRAGHETGTRGSYVVLRMSPFRWLTR